MNARDSEFVIGVLSERGFKKVDSAEKADVVLFNSCSVRKHAEDRLFSNIADLKKLKAGKPGLLVGLMGCTAQSYKDKALERAPVLDFVCGPGNEADLPEIIANVLKDRCPVVATDKTNEKRPELFPEYRQSAFKTFVSIGEGCNNFCSYCIVPYVRGRERSRDAKDIVREIRGLAGRGFREITLLGQNVNSYKGANGKGQGASFVKLLEGINSIDGIERVRFMTSHPKDASTDLFKAMRDLEKVCEHLHLPVQSGSDRILKLMNRGYTSKKYIRLVQKYKEILPKGALTTDIIVGFPGESDRDFNSTLKLIKDTGFDSAFSFKYSPRPPARSAKLKDNVPADVKQKRLEAVIDMQCDISQRCNAALKGKTLEILVDGCGSKDPRLLTGRTRTNKITVFNGSRGLIGKFVNVIVESVTPYALKGRMV